LSDPKFVHRPAACPDSAPESRGITGDLRPYLRCGVLSHRVLLDFLDSFPSRR
jgi:hypothetical protein